MRVVLEEKDLNEVGRQVYVESGLDSLEFHHFRVSTATIFKASYVSFEPKKGRYKVLKERDRFV